MTLAVLIAYVDAVRPNAYDKDVMTGWVNEIESKVYEQVISRAEDADDFYGAYTYDEDAELELLVDDAHKDVYTTYLMAQMDFANMEIDRYNVDAAMHQAAWNDYAAEYRRNNLPKSNETTVSSFWDS